MSRGGRPRLLPLPAWVAVVLFTTTLAVLVVVGVVLRLGGNGSLVAALAAGLGAGLLITAAGAAVAHGIGLDIRRLAASAVHRSSPADPRGLSVAAERISELQEMGRLLDALQLRARVAEEMAEQAQRTAHTAGAGMFELLSGLVAAEEATRGQLSADLHDTVAQTLMAARSLLGNPEGQPGAWERVREFVEDAEEQLRAAMARTRPPELRDGDLASAVAGLRREMAARYLLDVSLTWPTEPYPLPLVSAVTIYRFFQEALLNVVKHADVDEAHASLAIEGDYLIARVTDDGPGFDPDAVQSTGGRHVGLGLLRERARLAGGSLGVNSALGQGTVLTLRLSLTPQSPARDPGRITTSSDRP